jgi:hypothetical protein
VCQLCFVIGTLISGGDPQLFAIAVKILFLTCEYGSLWLLYMLLKEGSKHRLLIYALNPLVLIELMGNLHFEAIMILLILAMLRFLQRTHLGAAAAMLAGAIATKLLPLIFIPFLWKRMNVRKAVLFTLLVAVMCSVLFIPLVVGSDGSGFIASLDLYFRRFEFNASLYYILRWMGSLYYGYNPIALAGPISAILGGLMIIFFASRDQAKGVNYLPHILVLALSLYFICATTVHPWYLCTMIALCAMTDLRFPLIWSGVVFLSYSAYRQDSTGELLWIIIIEYLIVAIWIFMDRRRIRAAIQ